MREQWYVFYRAFSPLESPLSNFIFLTKILMYDSHHLSMEKVRNDLAADNTPSPQVMEVILKVTLHIPSLLGLCDAVFVLDDGGETDLDLGNYERFLSVR